MAVPKALAELKKISAQIHEAVAFTGEGAVVAATVDDERAKRAAEAASKLLSEADALRDEGSPSVTQLQAATGDADVFVVREGDRAITATTGPDPLIGLVMYDLRTCLRALPEKKKRAARRKKAESA